MTGDLADAARRLKPHRRGGRRLPRLIVMTDRHRLISPRAVVACLPRDALVIFRDYDAADRDRRALEWRILTRAAGIRLLVAGDPDLARRIKADGVHMPDRPGRARPLPRPYLRSFAVHDLAGLARAIRGHADLMLISPVFATQSHPASRPLGVFGFRKLARRAAPIAVAALGGLDPARARRLVVPRPQAFAGIGAFQTTVALD